MAIIKSHTSLISDGNTASIDTELPSHNTDDLLLIFASQDVGSATITISDNSWTEVGAGQAKSGGTRGAWFWKIAQSDSESAPTLNGYDSADWCVDVFVISGVDTSTPIRDSARSDWNNEQTIPSPTSSSATSGDLLIYGWNTDNIRMIRAENSIVPLSKVRSSGNVQISGYRYHVDKDGSETLQVNAIHEVSNEGGNAWLIVIASNDGKKRYNFDDFPYKTIKLFSYKDDLSGDAPSSVATSIDGIATSSATDDGTSSSPVDPSHLYASVAPWFYTGKCVIREEPSSDVWTGLVNTIDSNGVDFTDGGSYSSVCFTFWTNSKHRKKIGKRGCIAIFVDVNGNWEAYNFFTRDEISPNVPKTVHIDFNTKERKIDGSGDIDYTKIAKFGLAVHRHAKTTNDITMYFKDLQMPVYPNIYLGDADNMISPDFTALFEGWGFFGRNSFQGSGQELLLQGIRIGDSQTKSYFDFSKSSIEFKVTGDGWFIGEHYFDIWIDLSPDDYFDISNSIFQSENKQGIWFADNGKNDDMQIITKNASFINLYVTRDLSFDFDGASFDNCIVQDNSSTAFQKCSFKDCTIYTKDLSIFQSCYFERSDSYDDNAIYLDESITDVTFDWTSTFSNYPDGSGNELIVIQATSGTVTINVKKGADTPTYQTLGATVVVNPPSYSLKLTNIVDGSEVRIYKKDDMSELAGVENLSGTTFEYDFNLPSGQTEDIIIVVFKTEYQPVRYEYTLENKDIEMPITQIKDRWYSNP